MLETSEERITKLKTGYTQKQIEKMYIQSNGIEIISLPIQYDIVEIEEGHNNNTYKTSVESIQSLSLTLDSILDISQYKTFSAMIH